MEVGEGSHPLSALVTYFHQDHLGGTQLTSDEFGRVTQVYDYLPYGSQALSENLGNNEANHSFTDKEFHEDLGLYYFEARYYNPETAHFTSMDPQSLNGYSYSRNNPVNLVDPSGLGPTKNDILRYITHPKQGWYARNTAKPMAENAAQTRFRGESQTNTIADAYRHAYWAATITRKFDEIVSYEITTAHEIDSGNSIEVTEMDMHNNQVGITIASDPQYADLTVEELMEIAIEGGLLQIQPNSSGTSDFETPTDYNITQEPSYTSPPPTASSYDTPATPGVKRGQELSTWE